MKRCVTQRDPTYSSGRFLCKKERIHFSRTALLKPNWACSACGMYSGRKESVMRHIRNKNIHNGFASVIPFVDSLIARQSGFYEAQYVGRRNLFRHPNTGFELFQKALAEKMAEKLAEKLASTSLQPQPSYPLPSIHDHLSSFFADTENLFAIEAIICNLSLAMSLLRFSTQNLRLIDQPSNSFARILIL